MGGGEEQRVEHPQQERLALKQPDVVADRPLFRLAPGEEEVVEEVLVVLERCTEHPEERGEEEQRQDEDEGVQREVAGRPLVPHAPPRARGQQRASAGTGGGGGERGRADGEAHRSSSAVARVIFNCISDTLKISTTSAHPTAEA